MLIYSLKDMILTILKGSLIIFTTNCSNKMSKLMLLNRRTSFRECESRCSLISSHTPTTGQVAEYFHINCFKTEVEIQIDFCTKYSIFIEILLYYMVGSKQYIMMIMYLSSQEDVYSL